MEDNMLVLTPSALLAFLSQIEELNQLDIQLEENDSSISIKIGNNTYSLESNEELIVEDELVDTLDSINEEGYQEVDEEAISRSIEYADAETVEGGIIKELIKTLAIGGLVRLTKDAITKA